MFISRSFIAASAALALALGPTLPAQAFSFHFNVGSSHQSGSTSSSHTSHRDIFDGFGEGVDSWVHGGSSSSSSSSGSSETSTASTGESAHSREVGYALSLIARSHWHRDSFRHVHSVHDGREVRLDHGADTATRHHIARTIAAHRQAVADLHAAIEANPALSGWLARHHTRTRSVVAFTWTAHHGFVVYTFD